MRTRTAAAFFGLLLGVNGALDAADPEESPPQRELLLFEEPLVTAAAKRPQTTQSAPSSVTVITREEIRAYGYRTLAEALSSVRGFYRSYDRNYTYLGVRGFLRPGDYNDRILLLVNGHTYNDDVFQQAFFGPEFGIDLEAVERIEVVRGPGAALYGGNALFAVINVVTATGAERPGAHAVVETGSFGRKRGQVSFGRAFENGLDLFVSGSVLDVDGHDELFYPEYASRETNRGFARDADGERALDLFLSARHGSFYLQGGANDRTKYIPTGAYDTAFGDPDTRTIDGRYFFEVQYAPPPVAGVLPSARLYYDGMRYHGTYVYGTGAERVKNEDRASSHWVGGELKGERQVFPGNRVTLGTEYAHHPDARQRNFDVGGEEFLDDSRSFGNWGLYGQDEWTVLPQVTLTAGLRFDRYYDQQQELSPRLSAIWSPDPTTAVKLLFGKAFRPPNLYEQYYASETGLGSLPNANLDAERITTYEVVLERELTPRFRAVASVYHYKVDDLVDQTVVESPDTGDPVVQFQNLGTARATGGELGLHMSLPGGASGRMSYSHQQAELSGGARPSNSPRHLGTASLRVPLPHGLQSGFELLVVGPRRTLAGRTLDTVTLANLNLISPTPLHGLDVGVGLYNLLDREYSDPAGAEHQQDSIPQDRFTFRAQIQYAF